MVTVFICHCFLPQKLRFTSNSGRKSGAFQAIIRSIPGDLFTPGFKTLARRMGITATSARNHARSLERKGYLKREKRVGTTNLFNLTPLFQALEKLQAYEAGKLDERKAQRKKEKIIGQG